MILVGDHPEHGFASFYNVDLAIADVNHARLNSRMFAISAYAIGALCFALRVFFFFASMFLGALTVAELMLIFCWVEPVTLFFVWTRYYGLLFAAFWIVTASMITKGIYLALWVHLYWGALNRAWWWSIAGTLGVYLVVSLALLFCVANVLKAKAAFCCLVNDLERIDRRKGDSTTSTKKDTQQRTATSR